MKTIVTCLTINSFLPKWLDCIYSQKKYCEKYNFEYELVQKCPHNNPWWYKMEHIRELLETDYNYIVLIDADIFINSSAPSILDNINEEKYIFIAKGISGRPNSGVIILKNDIKTKQFFDNLLLCKSQPIDQKDPDYVNSFGENGHVIKHCKNSPLVQIIDHKWNNNTDIHMTDYFRHYCAWVMAAAYLKERNERFNKNIINTEQLLNNINEINNIVQKYNMPVQGNVWTKQHNIKEANPFTSQKINVLRTCSGISQNMLEIGFNAGHSAVTILEHNPDLKLTSCDICINNYTDECAEYVKMKYNNFKFMRGDSKIILQDNIGIFDTIFIDGGHAEADVISDILYSKNHAHSNTCLIVDDLDMISVQEAIKQLIDKKIIKSSGNVSSMFIGYYVM